MSSSRFGFRFGRGGKALSVRCFPVSEGVADPFLLPVFPDHAKAAAAPGSVLRLRGLRFLFPLRQWPRHGESLRQTALHFQGFKLLSVRGLAVRLHYGLSESHRGGSKRFNLECELLHRWSGVVIQAGGRTRSSPFLTTSGRRGKVFLLPKNQLWG